MKLLYFCRVLANRMLKSLRRLPSLNISGAYETNKQGEIMRDQNICGKCEVFPFNTLLKFTERS